jgi:heptaprenyl diphosphate synthase
MKKAAYLGLFLAISLILSYVESIIPVIVPVPGIKLGLANVAILILLYLYGPREAGLINLARVIISAFMFNGLYSLMYSLTGAVFSFLIMFALYRKEKVFSPVGVGMLGGLFHNIGQVLVAFLVTRVGGLVFYLPILMVSGLFTGALVGFITKQMLPYLRKTILAHHDK